MATRSLGVVLSQSSKFLLRNVKAKQNNCLSKRHLTNNESGGILGQPEQVRFGLLKLSVVALPFLYVGAIISREFAAWLEEHELFVPDDDDDDD